MGLVCKLKEKALPTDEQFETLWQQRYRQGQPPMGPSLNETLKTMLTHRTYRDYLPIPLPEGALETAIAAAQSAPSSSAMQAWDVVVVRDPERKARINALSSNQKQIAQAPVILIWIANLSRLRRIAKQLEQPDLSLNYIESFTTAVVDASLAAQNALVALESLGLSTCYIGALRNHPIEVAKELDLPPESFPVFGMTVGVPDVSVNAGVRPRLPQRAVLHYERYQAVTETDLADYDEIYKAFQTEQKMKPVGWSQTTVDKIKGPDVMRNREQLKPALLALGFKLD